MQVHADFYNQASIAPKKQKIQFLSFAIFKIEPVFCNTFARDLVWILGFFYPTKLGARFYLLLWSAAKLHEIACFLLLFSKDNQILASWDFFTTLFQLKLKFFKADDFKNVICKVIPLLWNSVGRIINTILEFINLLHTIR